MTSLVFSETPAPTAPVVADPCNPSPCGSNADCTDKNSLGVCICRNEYHGNPYIACKPECVLDSDCSRDKNCDDNKCKNPCPGQCGSGAECHVANHIIMCNCPEGYTGDPFSYCRPVPQTVPPPFEPQYTNPCVPSPCGRNAQCREANNAAVCSCLAGYHGDPTIECRPECVLQRRMRPCPWHASTRNAKIRVSASVALTPSAVSSTTTRDATVFRDTKETRTEAVLLQEVSIRLHCDILAYVNQIHFHAFWSFETCRLPVN